MTLNVRLARIDSRLLHGQVATIWTRTVQPNRILVISDGLAADSLRKKLVTQAAPPGVEVNVLSLADLAKLNQIKDAEDIEAFLLFETPQDVLRAVHDGLSLQSVNVGSLSFTDGKKMVADAVAVGSTDATAFRQLSDAGIKLEVRKVPSDQEQDLIDLLMENGL